MKHGGGGIVIWDAPQWDGKALARSEGRMNAAKYREFFAQECTPSIRQRFTFQWQQPEA